MNLSLSVLIALTFTVCSIFAAPQAAYSQSLKGEKGRVVIVDFSGSMGGNFGTTKTKRMVVARRAVKSTINRLINEGDRIPTAVLSFGSGFSWLSWKTKNGDRNFKPSQYPPAGDPGVGCSDHRWQGGLPNFQQVSRGFARSVEAELAGLSEGGMTPLAGAFIEAISQFDPKIGGEVIFISDFQNPNCQTTDFCTSVQNAISKITRDGGIVETTIVPVPTTNTQAIELCTQPITIPLDPSKEDPTEAIGIERPLVTPVVRIGKGDSLDVTSIPRREVALEVTSPTGGIAHKGPAVPFNIEEGKYAITASLNGREVSRTEISVTQNTNIDIALPVAILDLSAQDASGSGIDRLDRLEIIRVGSSAMLAQIDKFLLGSPLKLSQGQYQLFASARGETASLTIKTQLGKTTHATLRFGGSISSRDVGIVVNYVEPTLQKDLAQAMRTTFPNPSVTLVQNNGPRIDVSAGWSGKLSAGKHEVEIGGGVPQRLAFSVAEGTSLYELRVDVVPGGFSARIDPANGPLGKFILKDNAGIRRIEFNVGQLIEHSLPEGAYILEYVTESRDPVEKSLTIANGRWIDLNF